MTEESLIQAFLAGFSEQIREADGDAEALLAFCDDAGTFVVDDLPYPLDKSGFADHRSFHSDGLWERVKLAILSLNAKTYLSERGSAGLVHGTYNLRGKPSNAGFRQRPGNFSAVCAWDAKSERWTALNIHFSPLFSQVLDASPS